ncbi:MAG: hypothetical protein HRT98_02400 [Mycoplasmatales bacterium]|nr:hypothetical protein [Mycoplasmatales bacterium]
MSIKNTVITKKINNYGHEEHIEFIILHWITAGMPEIATQEDQEKAHEISLKLGRDFSEAFASHEISKLYNTELVYSNVAFSPTKGEAKGIDVIHVDDDKNFYIIEIKFTKTNTSGNFTKVKDQLKERFEYQNRQQLNTAIRNIKRSFPKYINSNFYVKVDEYFKAKNDINHRAHDFMIPTAVVITEKEIKPSQVTWLHKIQFVI